MKSLPLLLILFAAFFSPSLSAQVDTQFWFAAGYNCSEDGSRDRPINIWVTTFEQKAVVSVSIPANSLFTPIVKTIPAHTTEVFELTDYLDQIQCTSSVFPQAKGLFVSSTANITAYFEQNSESNPDIFTLKGDNALGTSFYVPSQTDYSNPSEATGWYFDAIPHTFVIVAAFNSTEVEITPTYDLENGHNANIPFTVTLDRGETYVCQSTSRYYAHNLAGSKVTSNKAIAITVNDDSIMYLSLSITDLAGDQIIPISSTGKEYIVVKGFLVNAVKDRVYVTGITDNTEVTINGATWKTINASETERYSFNSSTEAIYIQADTNIYVWHVSGYDKQSAAAILPPIRCTGSDTVVFNRSMPASASDASFALMVITQSGNQNTFKVRGSSTLLQGSDFSDVPNTGGEWVYARRSYSNLEIPFNTIIDVVNTSGAYFHLGVLNGNSANSCRYGYFSNFETLNLGRDRDICHNSETTLDAGIALTYEWSTGENTRTVDVEDGTYWVKITREGCDIILKDTIVITDNIPQPTVSIPVPTPLCSGNVQTLDAGSGFESYEWMDNPANNLQTFEISTAGEYWVKVTNSYTCENADTVTYAPKPRPVKNSIMHH